IIQAALNPIDAIRGGPDAIARAHEETVRENEAAEPLPFGAWTTDPVCAVLRRHHGPVTSDSDKGVIPVGDRAEESTLRQWVAPGPVVECLGQNGLTRAG